MMVVAIILLLLFLAIIAGLLAIMILYLEEHGYFNENDNEY